MNEATPTPTTEPTPAPACCVGTLTDADRAELLLRNAASIILDQQAEIITLSVFGAFLLGILAARYL